MPPPQNPQYIKASDNSFYLAKTDSEYFTVDGLKSDIANNEATKAAIQASIDIKKGHLAAAAAIGVADAAAAVIADPIVP